MTPEDKKHNFLFRCIDCGTILDVKLDEEEEIQDTLDEKTILTCPCGELMSVLLD